MGILNSFARKRSQSDVDEAAIIACLVNTNFVLQSDSDKDKARQCNQSYDLSLTIAQNGKRKAKDLGSVTIALNIIFFC